MSRTHGVVKTQCKACRNAQNRASYRQLKARGGLTPEQKRKKRGYMLNYCHGLTNDQYEAGYLLRGGLCDICQQQLPLDVDHDHVTGRLRGLLCRKCNNALGLFSDDTDRLKRAVDYLMKSDFFTLGS